MYTFHIEMYTSGLIITGSYDLPLYRRVSDALNSGMYRYITLRDATVAPMNHPHHGKHVPQMLVDWSGALLVATLAEPEPPPGLRAAEMVPRDAQPMMFFTSAFALRGNFYKRPDLDLGETLARMTEDFISLSEVQIFPHTGGQPITRRFACLNRGYTHALYAMGASTVPVVAPAAAAPAPVPAPSTPDVPHTEEHTSPQDEATPPGDESPTHRALPPGHEEPS